MITCSWLPTGAWASGIHCCPTQPSVCSCSGVVMTVDVFLREALADDLLLGRTHVPLAPLLQVGCLHGVCCAVLCCPVQHIRICRHRVLMPAIQSGAPPLLPRPACRRAVWMGGQACLRWCPQQQTPPSMSGCRSAPCTWSCRWRRRGRPSHQLRCQQQDRERQRQPLQGLQPCCRQQRRRLLPWQHCILRLVQIVHSRQQWAAASGSSLRQEPQRACRPPLPAP